MNNWLLVHPEVPKPHCTPSVAMRRRSRAASAPRVIRPQLKVFVIVDDVWAPDAVQAFSIRADGSAILLTGRISVTNIELLNELEADELFRAYANIADNVALDELQRKILGHRNRHAGLEKLERIDRLGGDRLTDFEVSCG